MRWRDPGGCDPIFYDCWGDGGWHGPISTPQPQFKGYKDLDPNRTLNDSLGLPAGMRLPTGGILDIFGVGTPGCEFGACNGPVFNATEGQGQIQAMTYSAMPILEPASWMLGYLARRQSAAQNTVKHLKGEGLHLLCGPSKPVRILSSIKFGGELGFVTGGFNGFVAGEAAGGAESGGLSGAPGWAIGAVTGGSFGMGGGAVNGFLLAHDCEAAGAYK